MKIVVDAEGSDNGAESIVSGIKSALLIYKNLEIFLAGKASKLLPLVKTEKRITVIDSTETITNNDSPVEAIKIKKNSSLVLAFDFLKNNKDCIGLISAGSTGAILAGGLLKIGRIAGVLRPALSPLLPTEKDGSVLLIDCGANVDSKAINLVQFAIMGSVYYKEIFAVQNPRVALLNIGTEEKKGNEFSKECFELLKKAPINFVGNMEARDLMSGNYDIVVSDGFAGNIALKATEGTSQIIMRQFKKAMTKNIFSKIGLLFAKNSLKQLKTTFDYKKYGGSPLLGLKKIVFKCHGASNPEVIKNAIGQVIIQNDMQVNCKILEVISNYKQENED
ncbi:MAG: phosphate acyltransferase PlsX [Clostridia bacterium]